MGGLTWTANRLQTNEASDREPVGAAYLICWPPKGVGLSATVPTCPAMHFAWTPVRDTDTSTGPPHCAQRPTASSNTAPQLRHWMFAGIAIVALRPSNISCCSLDCVQPKRPKSLARKSAEDHFV